MSALGGRNRLGSLLAILQIHEGGWVKYEELVDYVWGDREDGGPLSAMNCVAVMANRLRNRGYDIAANQSLGLLLVREGDPTFERFKPKRWWNFDPYEGLPKEGWVHRPSGSFRKFEPGQGPGKGNWRDPEGRHGHKYVAPGTRGASKHTKKEKQ